MNKAIFGILAAALVTSAKKLGSKNSSIKQYFIDLSNSSVRPDTFWAVACSFIDFKNEDYEFALSKITDSPESYTLEEQPMIIYGMKSDKYFVDSLAESIEKAIVSSFESEEEALKALNQNAKKLKDSYDNYFSENDFGLAYLYLQSGVFPELLSTNDWLSFFKGSKKSQSFVDFSRVQNLQELDELRNIYFSAILRGDLSYNVDDNGQVTMSLGENFSTSNIFSQINSIFDTLRMSKKTKDLPVQRYVPLEIRNLLDSDQSIQGLKASESYDNLMMLSLFIDGMVWVKQKLISMGQQGIDDSTTFLDMYNFWNIAERAPTNTMVSVQMDLYRKNPLTYDIPNIYKKENGEIEQSWAKFGTDAWSVGAWIIYYIYEILENNPSPSFSKWSFGSELSQRIFPIIKNGKINKLKRSGNVNSFMEKVYESYVSEGTQNIIDKISSGDTSNPSEQICIGFNSENNLDIKMLGNELFASSDISEDNIIQIYKGTTKALEYMGAFLCHCLTASQEGNPTIYSVFYMGVPYYTIEVDSTGGIIQFKGYKNRALGTVDSYTKLKSVSQSKRKALKASKLFLDDIRNFISVYNMMRKADNNIYISEVLKQTDLFLVNESDLQRVYPQSGLSYTIESFLS